MSLLLASKRNRKRLRNCKNETMLEKRIYVFRGLRVKTCSTTASPNQTSKTIWVMLSKMWNQISLYEAWYNPLKEIQIFDCGVFSHYIQFKHMVCIGEVALLSPSTINFYICYETETWSNNSPWYKEKKICDFITPSHDRCVIYKPEAVFR